MIVPGSTIGILGGGSLFMWRDFLGKKAKVIGIEMNPNSKILEKSGFKICSSFVDQMLGFQTCPAGKIYSF